MPGTTVMILISCVVYENNLGFAVLSIGTPRQGNFLPQSCISLHTRWEILGTSGNLIPEAGKNLFLGYICLRATWASFMWGR